MLRTVLVRHHCMWQHYRCVWSPSRSYLSTMQTSTRRITMAIRHYTGASMIRRQSSSVGDYWSMGPTQIFVPTNTELHYTERRFLVGSRSLDCYSATERR